MAKKLTHEEYKDRIDKLGVYELLTEYKNMASKVTVKCKVCGNITEIKAQNAIMYSCIKCENIKNGDKKRFSIEILKQYLEKYTDGTYEYVSGEYKVAKSPVIVRHKDCGREFVTSLDLIKQDHCICRDCFLRDSMSKGEYRIYKILSKLNLKFKEQHSFDDLILERKLKFDFAVFNEDDSVKFLIEYDGEGHFNPNIFPEDSKRGKGYVKLRDKMKDEYCKNNNIKLLRIPYFNIKEAESYIKNMI